jgi:hypothetical protein
VEEAEVAEEAEEADKEDKEDEDDEDDADDEDDEDDEEESSALRSTLSPLLLLPLLLLWLCRFLLVGVFKGLPLPFKEKDSNEPKLPSRPGGLVVSVSTGLHGHGHCTQIKVTQSGKKIRVRSTSPHRCGCRSSIELAAEEQQQYSTW